MYIVQMMERVSNGEFKLSQKGAPLFGSTDCYHMGHVEIPRPRGRISCCIWPFLQPKHKHNVWWASEFWRQYTPHLGVLFWPIYH